MMIGKETRVKGFPDSLDGYSRISLNIVRNIYRNANFILRHMPKEVRPRLVYGCREAVVVILD